MIFDARDIARGWLSVALASAKDKARPALNKTLFIESYGDGVRLVATDSVILLHAWVPSMDNHGDPGPSLDATPQKVGIAMDPHGRAVGFLKHALKLALVAEKKELDPIHVRLRLDVADEGTSRSQGTLEGLEARYIVLEHPDVESLRLQACEGAYPDWRKVLGTHAPDLTTHLALAPDVIATLGKLGKIQPGCRVGWGFGGQNEPAAIDVIESDPYVAGLVMPCRWDLDTNAPRVDDVVAEAERALREAAAIDSAGRDDPDPDDEDPDAAGDDGEAG